MHADIIIHGGAYFLGKGLEENNNFIVIKDGRIAATGPDREWAEYAGKDTKIIELSKDQLVVPGFHDSHLHCLMAAMNYNFINLIDVKSEEEAAEAVYEFSKSIPDDPWVIGLNWYHMGWKSQKLPSKESLDKYFPDRPVFLINTEVHGAWVNSKALEIIGIGDDTPNPPNGEITRDENGEATGYLNEMAMGLAAKEAFKFTINREKELIRKVCHTFASNGVTAIQDMRPELGYNLGQFRAFHELSVEKSLDVRVHSAANLLNEIDGIAREQEKYNNDIFRICLFKQYMDGVPTTHTATVVEPYKDEPDIYGEPINDIELMQEKIYQAHRQGISVKIHCCGDRAVKETLNMYENAIRRFGKTSSRHAIEHMEIIQPEDIKRMKELDIIGSVQPEHMVAQVNSYSEYPYPIYYSDKQMDSAWVLKTLLDNDIRLVFGTDCPVVDINPLINIYRAVTRTFNDGNPAGGFNPEEKISVEDALHCYTYNPAYSVHREHELGTLQPGKLADLAVLDRNILKCSHEDIKETQVIYTIMNGEITYSKQ